MSSARDVGAMAESTVRNWAAQCGIHANRVEQDATGWDFLLEFRRPQIPPELPRSLDHEPAATAALIQVKGTDSRESVSIKLDNLKRLVEWPLPAFILVLVYEGADDPRSAYLIPIDEEISTRVLQRLRAMSEAERSELHESRLTITWQPEYRLERLNGRCLAERIVAHAGTDQARYALQKVERLKSLGYSDQRYSAELILKGRDRDDVERKLVDFAIGVTDKLSGRLRSVQETRFGITLPMPANPSSAGESDIRIKPLPAAGRATLSIRSKNRESAAHFDCEYYDPRILFPNISRDNTRFRFVSPCVDFILSFDCGKWDFNFTMPTLDQVVLLEPVATAYDLMSMLEDSSTDHLELSLSLNGSEPARAHFDPRTLWLRMNIDPAIRGACKSASDAWRVARYVELPRDIKVSLGALGEYSEKLTSCRALVDPACYSELTVSGRLPGAPTGRLGYPFVSGAVIGNFVVMIGVAVCGVPQYTGEADELGATFVLNTPSVTVVTKDVIPITGRGRVETGPYYARIVDWMKKKGLELIPAPKSLPEIGL